MSRLRLIIGNYNYSSWSLRPWALMRHLGLAFDEQRIALDTPTFAAEVARYSPTGRVPVLIDGDLTVWESTAILEYVSELAAGRGWPAERAHRAWARAVSAEMHSGFAALRSAYPMNIRAHGRVVPMTGALAASILRIDEVWTTCRRHHGAEGPWLFGSYSAADAMYLPVALRFRTYGDAGLGELAREYLRQAVEDPVIEPWIRAAHAEPEVIASEEVGAGPTGSR